MKKVLLLIIFLMATTPLQAGESTDRLLNGLKNFGTAPLEIPKKAAYYSQETNYHPLGVAAGIGEGGIAAAQKFLAGIIQIFTFPFDSSEITYDLYE